MWQQLRLTHRLASPQSWGETSMPILSTVPGQMLHAIDVHHVQWSSKVKRGMPPIFRLWKLRRKRAIFVMSFRRTARSILDPLPQSGSIWRPSPFRNLHLQTWPSNINQISSWIGTYPWRSGTPNGGLRFLRHLGRGKTVSFPRAPPTSQFYMNVMWHVWWVCQWKYKQKL